MTQTTLRQTVTRGLGACLLTVWSAPLVNAGPDATPALAGPHLLAQGHAELQARADVAFLTLSVTSEARRETGAAQDNAARTAALTRAVQALKIAGRDIQTADYTAGRQFNARGLLIGYQVTNTVRVTLHDLSLASRLIDLAAQNGATRITALTYDLTDRQDAENRALTLAAQDARRRAEAIAAAMNVGLGGLRSVSDGGGATFGTVSGRVPAEFAGAGLPGSPATPISPQEITITADVTADYNLGDLP